MTVTKIKYVFAICMISVLSSYGQKHTSTPDTIRTGFSKTSWLVPSKFTPLELLQILTKKEGELNFITVENDFPDKWMKESDIDTLINLISSKTKCKCLVNPLSSYLPTTEESDLGGYAIMFINSYRKDKQIKLGLHICPKSNEKEISELRKWWFELHKK